MNIYKELKTTSNHLLKLVLLSLALLFSTSSIADNMSMPVSEQGSQSTHVPKNGQKMEKVESQYGQPIQRVAPVGEPPISKWVYSDFTVYFENDIVLTSVLHHR